MPVIHRFDPPERFVPGTVGEPGSADLLPPGPRGRPGHVGSAGEATGADPGRAVDELLDELIQTEESESTIPAITPVGLIDNEPLDQPIEEEFRAGTITLSWDADDERVVIEVFPVVEVEVESRSRPRSRS